MLQSELYGGLQQQYSSRCPWVLPAIFLVFCSPVYWRDRNRCWNNRSSLPQWGGILMVNKHKPRERGDDELDDWRTINTWLAHNTYGPWTTSYGNQLPMIRRKSAMKCFCMVHHQDVTCWWLGWLETHVSWALGSFAYFWMACVFLEFNTYHSGFGHVNNKKTLSVNVL